MSEGWSARFASWRLRRQLRKTPRFSLAELPEDTIARVSGTVRVLGGQVLTAPLSGRPCVYYTVTIRARPHFMSQEAIRELLATEHREVPFLLDDGANRAVVDPTNARISCDCDHRTTSKAAFDATRPQRELLERYRLTQQDWWNTASLEYVEGILAVDEPIIVLGGGTREPDPDGQATAGYREAGSTRYRFASTRRFPLLISDDPKSQLT